MGKNNFHRVIQGVVFCGLLFICAFSQSSFSSPLPFSGCREYPRIGPIYYLSNVDVIFIGEYITTQIVPDKEGSDYADWAKSDYRVIQAFKGMPSKQKVISIYHGANKNRLSDNDLTRYQPFHRKSDFLSPEYRLIEASYRNDLLQKKTFSICERFIFSERQKFLILNAYKIWPLLLLFILVPLILLSLRCFFMIRNRLQNRRSVQE